MNILGISAFYQNSSCCLLQDGKLVAAASEERFTRIRNDRRAPVNAFRFCLEQGGYLSPSDIDAIAFYETPHTKLSRQLAMGINASADRSYAWLDAGQVEVHLRRLLGFEGPIEFFEHQLSHAASAYFYSGFSDSAVMTLDGVGEWDTLTYLSAQGQELKILDRVCFPDSLGLFFGAVTEFLGFEPWRDENKVMFLAGHGQPQYVDEMRTLLRAGTAGQFSLDARYFHFAPQERLFTPSFMSLFKVHARHPRDPLEQVHKDIACSLQLVLEETLLRLLGHLHSLVPSDRLCLAGAVAMNTRAMHRLRNEGPFKEIFIQAAADDAGAALGAAALCHVQMNHHLRPIERPDSPHLGPGYTADTIALFLQATGIKALDFRTKEPELLAAVVDRLADKKVVAWFHGRMEFGPHGHGARGILADPRNPDLHQQLQAMGVKRESFMPLTASALEQARQNPFDGTLQLQTLDAGTQPRFRRLLEAFYARTACPVLLNITFNLDEEPIVCSIEDALRCMATSQIDTLILDDMLIDKQMIPAFIRRPTPGEGGESSHIDPKRVHPRLQGQIERWRPAENNLPKGRNIFL